MKQVSQKAISYAKELDIARATAVEPLYCGHSETRTLIFVYKLIPEIEVPGTIAQVYK